MPPPARSTSAGRRSGQKMSASVPVTRVCAGSRSSASNSASAAVRVQVHRRLVQQQQRGEAARLGDQRGVAQHHADQQRLLLAGAGLFGRECRRGVGQPHVGAVRAERGGAGGGVARAVGGEAGAQPVLHRQRRCRGQAVGDRAGQGDAAPAGRRR